MTNRIKNIISNPSLVCTGIVLISLLSLASALTAEHVFGMKPCTLCLLQRGPYILTAFLGLTGFLLAYRFRKTKEAAFTIFLSSLIFFAGAVIASYHVGVEQHWWVSLLEGCKVSFDSESTKNILAKIESTQAVRCDEIPWQMFSISMAGYNALMSAGLSTACLISSLLIVRKENGF